MQTRTLPLIAAVALSLTARASAFRYAEDQAPAIVNPLFTTSMSEARLHELVFEGLFTDDEDLATIPLLAASSTLSDDHREMVIQLRSDVKWHDGKPLTAADVVFTIEAMKNKGTLSTEAGRVAWIEKATAEGTSTLRLRFVRPEASPEDQLYFKILPAHAFDGPAVSRSDPFRTEPVGTGPYEVTRYNEDNSISLARFEGYRTAVGLPEIVMREVSDKNYQAKLLLYESLEALVRVLPRDLAVLQNNRKIELYPYQTNSWWYLGFNERNAPFEDARVRKALSMLIDIEDLLAPVGTGELVTGPFVRSSPFYNHDVPAYAEDEAAASALLTEAGYTRTDGAWTRGGKPLTLRLAAHKSIETSQEVVINLQSQWAAAGVSVKVDFLDEAGWKARVWNERDFDVLLSQWSFDRNEDVREQFHSRGSRNFVGYSSPEVDALLDQARDALDPQEKKAALRAVHARVHDDAPMIFLWSLDSYSAMNTRVRDVVIHPFYFFSWVRDWRMN